MSASPNQPPSIAQVFQSNGLDGLSSAEPVAQNELVRVERSAFEAMPHIVAGLGAWREAVPATPRVVHVIGCLTHGGAERQLATYAAAAHARGLASHSVLTFHPAEGAGAHFRPLLESAGVRIRALRDPPSQSALHAIKTNMKLRARMAAIPPHLGVEPMDFVGALLTTQPDVLHAWLDHSNILAGVAALAVGVKRVVLSLRSVSPPNFPAWYGEWMLPWYQALLTHDRVRIAANSRAGANDYARWIGIDPSRIKVVNNGFDPSQFTHTEPANVAALREELDAVDRPLLLGVFRLSDEKRPIHFVNIARRVLSAVPNARIVIAGEGAMRSAIEDATQDLGDSFKLLGRRSDISTLFAAADATLLCSRVEGFPNALIEAQYLGCPIVSTDAGGAVETFMNGRTGFLHAQEDVEGMADSLVKLLTNNALRAQFSRNARIFAAERFGLEDMVRATDALYR